MKLLWTMFFSIQIICYLPELDILVNRYSTEYFNQMTKLVNFSVLNPEGIVQIFEPEFKLDCFIAEL